MLCLVLFITLANAHLLRKRTHTKPLISIAPRAIVGGRSLINFLIVHTRKIKEKTAIFEKGIRTTYK